MKPYYEDAACTIYHADCRDVLPTLAGVDLLVTDPPYASGARRDAERQVRGSMLRSMEDEDWFSHDAMTSWGYSWFLRGILTSARERLVPGAHVYVFSDWRQTPNVYGMCEATGFRVNHCLVWDKRHYGMGAYWRNQHEHIVFGSHGTPTEMLDHGRGSVLVCPAVPSARREHPTEKPVALLQMVLSAVPGNLVLDPFMGVGPTLQAAKTLGKRAIGIELEERFCEKAAQRLTQQALFEAAPVADVFVQGELADAPSDPAVDVLLPPYEAQA